MWPFPKLKDWNQQEIDDRIDRCRKIRARMLEAKTQEELIDTLEDAFKEMDTPEAKWSQMAFIQVIPLLILREQIAPLPNKFLS